MIGPVAVVIGNHTASWDGGPVAQGTRSFRIGGTLLAGEDGRSLSELVANPRRRVGWGGVSGALEWLTMVGNYTSFSGWYLLHNFSYSLGPQTNAAEFGWGPFSLDSTYLGGQRQPVVLRSSRARASVYIYAAAFVAEPFRAQEPGTELINVVGARAFSRAYDPNPYNPRTLAPAGWTIICYDAGFSSLTVDPLPKILFMEPGMGADWAALRGGDCRAWDRREEREVLGASRGFQEPSDIAFSNGLIRCRVGARGIAPYLDVEAWLSNAWRSVGCLSLGYPTTEKLAAARVVTVTPDLVSIRCTSTVAGPVYVTLRRGQRSLEVQHGGDADSPTVNRRVAWVPTPPVTNAITGTRVTGRYDSAIQATSQVSFYWPQAARSTAWSAAVTWVPSNPSASLSTSTIYQVQDSVGVIGSVSWTQSGTLFSFTLGSQTVSVNSGSFSAGAITILVRFSTECGMAISVRTPAGTTTSAVNSALTNPSTADSSPQLLVFSASSTGIAYGTGNYGAAAYGYTTVGSAAAIYDQAEIFSGFLGDAAVTTLLPAADRGIGLPVPESQLVWSVPFDVDPTSSPTTLAATGRIEDTSYSWGATRGVAILLAGPVADTNGRAGVKITGTELRCLAYLAVAETGGTAQEIHAHYAAQSEQETRLR